MTGPKKRTRTGYFSRTQAASYLRITVPKLIGLQRKGVADAEKHDGQWWISSAAVEELRAYLQRGTKPRPGERAARAFELFRDGKSDSDVVIELRITTAQARALRLEEAGGGMFLAPAVVTAIGDALAARAMPLAGPESLATLVRQLCASDERRVALELQAAS